MSDVKAPVEAPAENKIEINKAFTTKVDAETLRDKYNDAIPAPAAGKTAKPSCRVYSVVGNGKEVFSVAITPPNAIHAAAGVFGITATPVDQVVSPESYLNTCTPEMKSALLALLGKAGKEKSK